MATATATAVTNSAAESILHPHPPTSAISKPGTQAPPPYTFSFTPFLRQHALASLTTTVRVCPAFLSGHCPLGRRCPDRHPTPNQTPQQHHYGRGNDNFVCKHWLKGLCKKGDACDYLHEYNLRKMSECQFYNQNGYCQNGDECLYVHVKEDSKLPLCEDYNAGFCAKGPRCGKRHVRRKLCPFYLAGFCPDGRDCKFGVHLKSGAGKDAEEDNSNNNNNKNEKARRGDRGLEQEKGGVGDEQQPKKEFGWKGGRGGRGGRWKNKRDRGRKD